MNCLKTFLNRNKNVSPSSKHSPFPGSGNLAQNVIFDGNMHEGESSCSREFAHWGHREKKHASKSSPLPMGNETPGRMRLVGSAKFIQTLGAESLEEEMDIFITMERPTPSNLTSLVEENDQMDESCSNHRIPSSQLFGKREFHCPAVCEFYEHASKSSSLPMGNGTPSRIGLVGTAKFIQTSGAESLEEEIDIFIMMERPTRSNIASLVEQDCQMDESCGDHRIPSSQLSKMRASHSPAVCEFYDPGDASTGYLTSHVNYPYYVIDPPRCSLDGFLTQKRDSVSSWDSTVTCSSSPDYRINFDSPQLRPHMGIFHEDYPLPIPPSSPSKSSGKCMPENLLPLPPPVNKEHQTSQRSQHMNDWRIQYPFQSSISLQQCPRNWKKGKVLGKEWFGTVYEALDLDDGSFFAVKISDAEAAAPEVQQEIDVLKRLNHPNIVRYLGSSFDDGHLCIFLELVGMGSLRHVLDKYKHFEETMIRTYTRQILRGLEYLHHQNTIHRDLKCANILLHPNGHVKLVNFGVAKQMSQSLANSCKGTPLHMAPEMIKPSTENKKYGLAVDIWSLGCTIIEMADGKPPWSDLQGFSFFFKADRGELPPIPDHLSFEAKDFLCRCLKVNPEERATVSELLKHPFITNAPLLPHLRSQRL